MAVPHSIYIIMFARLKLLSLLVVVLDLVLLGVMVHYTSWLFMLAFVFISGLVGGWLLSNGLREYVRNIGRPTDAARISDEPSLLGTAARLAAGVLFIVPGILTDLMALVLISPAGKWLVRFFIATLLGKMFPHPSNQYYSSYASGETPAKDKIIDVHIVNFDNEEPHNDP
jgi:UPF0716 protein FxsA